MRVARVLLVALVASTAACGTEERAAATRVDLPTGAAPAVLAESGGALLVGVRRSGWPGVLWLDGDGVTEVPVRAESPYAKVARWYSLAVRDGEVHAVGGERGGAHGNVRWSVWRGSAAGIAEQPQVFSTFGGWGAGDLIAAVPTPREPLLVGTWASARAGIDVAVWTAQGALWKRQDSAGTALESSRDDLGYAVAATPLDRGALVVGWRLPSGGGPQPVAWRSTDGNTGWTRAPLPDAGRSGTAVATRCWGAVCGAAGWVDGSLALWHLDGEWRRLGGVPAIPVGDRDRLAAPMEVDGRLTQVVSDGGRVKVLSTEGDGWTVRALEGPTGAVTEAVRVGDSIYLLAGPDADTQVLWRVEVDTLR